MSAVREAHQTKYCGSAVAYGKALTRDELTRCQKSNTSQKNLGQAKLDVIKVVNNIIAEYGAQGFQLTLRQLYYQFVARGLIANRQTEYDNLGATIGDGRLVGLVDWNAIIDRTRNLQSVPHWTDPAQIMDVVANQFRIDKWANQSFRPEVWIEKDALVGVIEGVCTDLDVPYFSCRGYTSLSEMWSGAMRLRRYVQKGQTPIILHFGDHDPSGRDMTRDIIERLQMFMGGVDVRRLALNMEQVEQYTPPPNPTKLSDSRAAAYIAEFGHECWELDALEPAVLAALVRDEIMSFRDVDKWAEMTEEEDTHRGQLAQASQRWDDVVEMLEG